YIDNITIKGLKTYYSFKEGIPRIQRFILKYIKNLDTILEYIKCARAIISGSS
ncbi:hypothetical protein L207DRAFT_446724, partial [Hyaloscypha variabilis F]